MFGIPESEIAKTLSEFERDVGLAALEITTCLRGFELEVDLRYAAADRALAEQLVDAIRDAHPAALYSEDGTTLDEQLLELLEGHTVAFAESCTAGLVAARATRLPGSSGHVAGGVVAYSDQAKEDLLGIDPGLIERHGAVSEEVARAMAAGALSRFGADIACSVTGIAGPGGGTEQKPVGLVYFCVMSADGRTTERGPVLPGRREDIRERAQTLALHLVRRHVLDANA